MAYREATRYLESFINYEKLPAYPYKESLKLERIKGFLDRIGNPQDAFRSIHIAGTKGKGSTCAFIAYILRQEGFKVGLYTSPHLSDCRERIRVLKPGPKAKGGGLDFEGMISRISLIGLVEQLRPDIERFNASSRYGPLSFFEVYTSLAFLYFRKKKVDFAVLETGLGGRLDATNVVEPLAVAISPISYEHTEKLGSTLGDIAREKAGIIKIQNQKSKTKKLIVISAPQEKEAGEVIRKRCKEAGAKLYEVSQGISYKNTKDGFNVKGICREYPDLKIRLLGRHQLINATVAVGVIEALRFYNIDVNIDSIRRGLYNTKWPGRCEVISRKPFFILDGAQNIASARAIKEAIKKNFRYRRLILILGISQDKDIKGICHELHDLADEVVLTRADNPRAADPEKLAKYFQHKKAYVTGNTEEAKARAYHTAKRNDLILATGSLFVVGGLRYGKA